jgi:hypothetical protein
MAERDYQEFSNGKWHLALKDVTSVTNERTSIAAIVPGYPCAHTLPVLPCSTARVASEAIALLNSFAYDFLARQRVQTNHLSNFILRLIAAPNEDAYNRIFGAAGKLTTYLGKREGDALTAGEIVRDHVLRLSYTAHDLEPYARDLGYEGGPFVWDETERMHVRARLDALHFHLYGVTDEADVRHILSTFPIVERRDRQAHSGVYLTEALILWYMRALAAGDVDAVAPVDALLRQTAA